MEASKLSVSLGSMGAAVVAPASPTTKLASRPRGTATCWSSAPDTRPIIHPVQTTNSPSPPLTTQSATPVTSATTSPQHIPYEVQTHQQQQPQSPLHVNSSPVAVRAAVHRADTGINTHTHTITRMPSSHKSEGCLDHSHSPLIINTCPSQTQSQNNLDSQDRTKTQISSEYTYKSTTSLPKRQVWQRSVSCRELYDFSFEDSGMAKRRPKPAADALAKLEERKLESPITRYDDHRDLYSSTTRNTSLEIHQDILMPDQKVYSSSYPGTTSYSQESMEDPGNYDLRDSQDDLSHDSYELLERSDDDYSTSCDYKKVKVLNTRSCSLDSGNYLPSDTDSEAEKRHKCKSSSDVHQDIFLMDDPRDFPREIIPRKSDGSYYKTIKSGSRTSSLESRSDYYESKTSKSSRESLKKNGHERSFSSRTSSQESKSDYETKRIRKNKSQESVTKKSEYLDSRTSSLDSKSEYYDAKSVDDTKFGTKPDFDRKIQFQRNYGTQILKTDGVHFDAPKKSATIDYSGFPSFKETSHVHSISLQNVETEPNRSSSRYIDSLEQNTVPRTQKSQNSSTRQVTHIWPENIAGLDTEIKDWPPKQQSGQRSSESESNIFSFDEDRIQSLQESSDVDQSFGVVPNIDTKQELKKKKNYKDVFIEIEPRKLNGRDLFHQPIERTKSDPNSLARQRLNSSSRRLLLMHQKSIDLTPAESSDEDYIYKQIPSAPPIMKYRGSHFEMPTAEFGHFDILKREIEGQKTKFEVPKSQFEVLGAKTQSDLINLPPKSDADIPYVLHKRHVINGTATKEESKLIETESIKTSKKLPESLEEFKKSKPKSPIVEPSESTSFLFTQNIDLSKIDPVTLEVDKTAVPIQLLSSPKRDITRIDPILLEALNSKLSQIESDSPTSSKTESLKPHQKTVLLQEKPNVELPIQKVEKPKPVSTYEKIEKVKPVKDKIKTDIKPKRIIKPRMQPNKKGAKNKTKVRITSFSSDDESLDSDDVFGSAEATPTKLEFSPPQTRKEMESILKFESERKYLQYTMSSTEVEGSPPQTRKSDATQYDRTLDPNYQTELRRISERSFSIPSSEDDLNIKTNDMQPVFEEPAPVLPALPESEKDDGDKSVEDTVDEQITVQELLKEEDLKDIEEEKMKEKEQLQADIEQDLQNLKVPPKTKITEICSPTMRKKGQSPLLFAHARLNLSEGSAFTLLQKQQATESPIPGRRAKSLDTPVISVSKLPPLNAFSSKDDTVEEEEQIQPAKVEKVAEKPQETVEKIEPVPALPPKTKPKILSRDKYKPVEKPKTKLVEKDQIVPDVSSGRTKRSPKTSVQTKPLASKYASGKAKPPTSQRLSSLKESKTNRTAQKPPVLQKPVVAVAQKAPVIQKLPIKTISKPEMEYQEEKEETKSEDEKSLSSQLSLTLPEIKRTKSQELESCKRPTPKEKAKSLEKLEFKRTISKERAKSQDDSDTDIAKRKEKQQMLYETAIKQTKTLKSPVKDVLPVFPQVEEMVRERHGKLEISINTIDNPNVSLEEAIIITKSPKKLDKKMDKKYTKSLELNLTENGEEGPRAFQRLGKSLDIDTRRESTELVFDFKTETIESARTEQEAAEKEETKIESDDDTLHETETTHDNVILEGTSLDVWLSVDGKKTEEEPPVPKLENITVIQKSTDFFENRAVAKPPDLAKIDTKSSSDSQSMERISLGNSLDIKYIDDSGDSSHKSEKDAILIREMQKATENVEKMIKKKMERRKAAEELKSPEELPEDKTLVRIISEDESLTEVSDLKCESRDQDSNFLGVADIHKDALMRLSIERSRSEDTGSWITVDCEEYVGEESFDYDNVSIEPVEETQKLKGSDEEEAAKQEDANLLTTEIRNSKIDLLKRSSDQSRSSDTTGSWTSGEKDLSPGNMKETGDESSLSCSMGRAIGLSQTIEKFATREQLDKSSPEDPRSPRSPRSPRICVLGRAFTIDEESSTSQKLDKDEESSSEGSNDIPKDLTPIQETEQQDESENNGFKYKKTRYPFEQKWSNESELSQKLHEKISKKLSSADKSFSLTEDSRRSGKDSIEKPSLCSVEKLSTESRNSLDTESSSGSLGMIVRLQKSGELVSKEPSSTWRPFPLESSGSSSLEEGILPTDQDLYGQEYFLSRENSGDFTALSDITYAPKIDDDITPTAVDNEELTFPYTSNLSLSGPDILGGYGTSFLSRTLSRISERSTNSEKSSLDEDSMKGSTQSDSVNDESMGLSDRQGSFSSDPPSNARVSDSSKKTPSGEPIKAESNNHVEVPCCEPIPNINSLLQRQISDDRRTSAEMAELSIDDIEIITSERGLKLKRQDSDDTIIDEEGFEFEKKKGSSSQESDEWPLPEIPQQKPLMALHETPSTDTSQITTQVYQPPRTNIPKTFGLRGSLKSQDSEQWPSPPSSVTEPPIVGNVETYYMTPPEEAYKVVVDSSTVSTYDNDSASDENKTLDIEGDKTHTYENVATERGSDSISESLSAGPSGVKIVLEKKSDDSGASNSEDLNLSNLNDDVFTDTLETSKNNELRPPTVLRRSTTSDDSSHSGKQKQELKPPAQKSSHSSYSDEDCTSSMGTTLEDGTVRYALKPAKCTHSSHSEDTSIALSLSEWSNSTNTVKFQNLSSNSGTTKSSSGLKSDDNSLTDIAHSISEWSSSNSNTLKAQSLQFQKLSSTTSTGDSTLTELVPNSESKPFFAMQDRQSISRLGSSVDDVDLNLNQELSIKSPKNIPSEDALIIPIPLRSDKTFTKSTERPIVIPVQAMSVSDTEKSTESSSMEQRTVHIQNYDKEKQRYTQKHQPTKSTERPVKVPLKLSKCSPYYSSSLSSESTPMASTATPLPLSKTATVPLTRTHRKPVSKHLFQTKSPPSENDSTSSMESPKTKSDSRDRRGYRRRRQGPQKRHRERELFHTQDDYFYVEHDPDIASYNEYIRNKSLDEMASAFHYENVLLESGPVSGYTETLEEGYYPDVDSQSGSDIFRMERDDDEKFETAEDAFDVSCIPPPLLEDDYDSNQI